MSVFACGNGKTYGELGDEKVQQSLIPIELSTFGDDPVVSVHANEHTAAAITGTMDIFNSSETLNIFN